MIPIVGTSWGYYEEEMNLTMHLMKVICAAPIAVPSLNVLLPRGKADALHKLVSLTFFGFLFQRGQLYLLNRDL